MEFISDNWKDIQRYYNNTYVKFQEFGEKLFYIRRVSSTEITGIDEDSVEFCLFLDNSAPYSIDYVLPHRAVFQFGDQAYLLQRYPQRQYSRGLSQDNTRIIPVMGGDCKSMSFSILKAFTNKQKYFTLREAMFDKGKQKSVALSSRFSFDRLQQRVLLDTTPVAAVDRASSVITTSVLFKNEVADLIAADSFPITIKHV